ncbi:hypothetical protein [Streptomyces boninensis]|uniref:hypothetical protein n=1 Tax=Streptomyces boninensis TaxID=2039455 RepID=UPI003B224D4E
MPLPRFRVELASPDEGIRRTTQVHADTIEEALVKARETDGLRVVAAAEETAESEARLDRNARRRYLNTIVESGLTALGKTVPERPTAEFSDVLCDFFTRAVVLPGHYPFASGDGDGDGEDGHLLDRHDDSAVLAELLLKHLAGHGLAVTQTRDSR